MLPQPGLRYGLVLSKVLPGLSRPIDLESLGLIAWLNTFNLVTQHVFVPDISRLTRIVGQHSWIIQNCITLALEYTVSEEICIPWNWIVYWGKLALIIHTWKRYNAYQKVEFDPQSQFVRNEKRESQRLDWVVGSPSDRLSLAFWMVAWLTAYDMGMFLVASALQARALFFDFLMIKEESAVHHIKFWEVRCVKTEFTYCYGFFVC